MEAFSLWLYMVIFLIQCQTGFSLLHKNTSMNHLCRADESQVLLQLKQQLSPLFPRRYYKTLYWNASSDCCLWDGVTCDDFTGHVIDLDLTLSSLTGKLESNSSLFHLTHLRNLNLAYNHFDGSTIPSEFAGLKALTHLNLSHARLGGEIPTEFYHLSGLVSLDLSNNDRVRCDVKMVFGNMTRLRVLLLTQLNLSNSELPMNMSSFLTHLDLRFTQLQGELPATLFEKPDLQILILAGNPGLTGSLPKSLNWSNVHSIKTLDLGQTSISGRLPDSIGLMSNLNYLRLSACRFSGPIPESIGNITGVTFIGLSKNEFSGTLSSTISNLRRLPRLDISHNHLEGQLPDAFSGLQNLTYLDLSYNNLEGLIPASLANMSKLQRLDISSNALTGPFPSRAGHGLQELQIMDFSNNSIQGTIPSWLFTLPSLEILRLSSNRLTGRIEKLNSEILHMLDLSSNKLNIELQSFYNLSSIGILLISHNTVTMHDDDTLNVTFSKLGTLEMSSCGINGFPNFLRSRMPSLHTLDLSNNSIKGPIPNWQSLRYLNLHSNSLRGTFPSSICNMSKLNALDLSDNKLSGNIPECLPNLVVLDLRMNDFHGKIPTTIGAMDDLVNLVLNGNHLEGSLPLSLANCTQLEVVDLGNNMLEDTFPWWLHTLRHLKILILKSNSFYGSITPHFTNTSFTKLQIFDLSYNNFAGPLPEKLFASLEAIKHQRQVSPYFGLYMGNAYTNYEYSVILSVKGADVVLTKVLRIFTTIDLSSNNFNGSIPVSLSNLISLRLLNLSHNRIHGSIPPALGCMTNLEQLDLSNNQLTGGIPQSLTNLTFLGALDLSHNHLVGPIPRANQFLTFSNESYDSNSGLCGAPLTKSCGDEREPPSTEDFEEEDEEEDGFMMGFTWKTVVIGYGCGTVLGFVLGYVMISMEKPKCLARFVYVEAAIILSRRKNRRHTVQGRR